MVSVEDRLAAEPMAFFPHDAGAHADIKCQRLIRRCGWEGYGRWWRLCELMAATKGHMIELGTDEDALILADVLGFPAATAADEKQAIEDVRKYVGTLLDIGLLTADGTGTLKSSRMLDNAVYFGRQRANGRKGGRPRKSKTASDGDPGDRGE